MVFSLEFTSPAFTYEEGKEITSCREADIYHDDDTKR